jgi:hypothetical protein
VGRCVRARRVAWRGLVGEWVGRRVRAQVGLEGSPAGKEADRQVVGGVERD